MSAHSYVIKQLATNDLVLMKRLLKTFGEAFDESDTYCSEQPGADYVKRLLGMDCFIALAALKDEQVVAGIAAYELQKFEQERSEIYIYDLAVAESSRRQGIATALISDLKKIAAARARMLFLYRLIETMHLLLHYMKNLEYVRRSYISVSVLNHNLVSAIYGLRHNRVFQQLIKPESTLKPLFD